MPQSPPRRKGCWSRTATCSGTPVLPLGTEPARRVGGLPAVHVLVSVQHLPPQLLGLDPTGELEVGELLPQQLRPQERLRDEAAAQPQVQQSRIRAAVPAPPAGTTRSTSPGTMGPASLPGPRLRCFMVGTTSVALLQLKQAAVVKQLQNTHLCYAQRGQLCQHPARR